MQIEITTVMVDFLSYFLHCYWICTLYVFKLSGKMLRGVCMCVWYMYVKVLDTFFFFKIQFVGTGVLQHVLRSEDNL